MTEPPDRFDGTPPGGDPTTSSDPAAGRPESEGPPPTPFDHPLFLPALLVGGCLWFGYDGYVNQDPEMLEHLSFNRFGVRILAYLSALFAVQGFAEWRRVAAPPFAPAAIHAALALWFAYDAFLNADPFYADYTLFNLQAALGMGAVGAWLGVTAMRAQKGERSPAFVLPLLILLAAGAFALSAWRGEESRLLHGMTAATLAAVSVWRARVAFAARRGATSGELGDG